MPKVSVLNLEGKQVSDIELDDKIFGIEPHKQAMFEAIIMLQAAERQGTHQAKTRGEVRGGGKKPWRQKGTGRARQGSIRSPQWRGGGVVFGPQPRTYKMKMNKKVYQLAMKSLYSSKVKDSNLVIINAAELDAPKTKTMVAAFGKLEAKKPLVITTGENLNLQLSVRNIPSARTLQVERVSVLDLAKAETVIMTEEAARKIEEVLG